MAVPKLKEADDATVLTGVLNGLFDNELVFDDNEEPVDNEEVESVSKFVLKTSFILGPNFEVSLDLEHSLGVKSVASEYEDEDDSELDLEEEVGLLSALVDMFCSAVQNICSIIFLAEEVGESNFSFAGDNLTLGLCLKSEI